jgi:hypothetical protein
MIQEVMWVSRYLWDLARLQVIIRSQLVLDLRRGFSKLGIWANHQEPLEDLASIKHKLMSDFNFWRVLSSIRINQSMSIIVILGMRARLIILIVVLNMMWLLGLRKKLIVSIMRVTIQNFQQWHSWTITIICCRLEVVLVELVELVVAVRLLRDRNRLWTLLLWVMYQPMWTITSLAVKATVPTNNCSQLIRLDIILQLQRVRLVAHAGIRINTMHTSQVC